MSASKGNILLVDDDPGLLRIYSRVLRHAGYEVDTASDGLQATQRLREARFDTVVSDISMPGADGVEVLKRARAIDESLPVVLMTAGPTIDSYASSVELGAFRYLIKPIEIEALKRTLDESIRLRRLAEAKRSAQAHAREQEKARELPALNESLDRALAGLWMAYQPIVSAARNGTIAFEALMRTGERSLPHPGAVLDAAERLGRLWDVGRAIRRQVGETVASLRLDVDVFVNLHPLDLLDDDLCDPNAPLCRQARRVVLELTERSALDGIAELDQRVARLRALGFRIAVDDLGAGYAGLSSFVRLKPEVVKLDMSLVRNIDQDATKQKLVATMVTLCRDLGAVVLSEGVETGPERDALLAMECDIMQGYLFGKPARDIEPVPFSTR